MKQKWLSLGPAQQFVAASVAAVAIWRLLFVYILHPIRIPDKILTQTIATGTTFIINLFSGSNASKAFWMDGSWPGDFGVRIIRDNRVILSIGDTCNGLELMLIYAGVIVLLPGEKDRKIRYVSVGILSLIIANMFRCAGLEWVFQYFPEFFEATHHYVFTLVMYVFIFIGWVKYINKLGKTVSNAKK